MRPGEATAFEALVDDYDAARPGYPDGLYDALPPLAGRRVVELGAGTGKATAGLLARGADVLATDLGPRMLGRLHRTHPQVPAAVARAEALPLRDASVDAVCGAQMWHWVDAPAAAAEAARVLRPGGWLAIWWNELVGTPEQRAYWARVERHSPGFDHGHRARAYGDELAATGLFGVVRAATTRWEWTLDAATYERWQRSKSYVAAMPDAEAFLAEERAAVARAFPDGLVRVSCVVRLWVAAA